MDISSIISEKLETKESFDRSIQVWEYCSFNVHRGALQFSQTETSNIEAISKLVRDKIKSEFKISWFRGFGFGVVIEAQSIFDDIESLESIIDTRNKPSGVWQWAIVFVPSEKFAIGVHTWTEGYLSSVYKDIIYLLREEGYEARSFKKSKGKMMNFLAKFAAIPEFENI